jgi:hypothetical protein
MPPLLERVHRALGPIAGGLLLDLLDLATFGPVGLVAGPVIGGLVGWWLGSLYAFSPRGRALLAAAAAVYLTVPFTEPVPVATLIGAVARFRERRAEPPEQ